MWHALFINIWQLSAICLLTSSPLHLSRSFRSDGGRCTFSGFSKNIWLGSSPDSGCWLGHSKTFTALCLTTLVVCLGSLSCWNLNLLPSLKFWMLWTVFSLWCFSSLSPSVPASEKQPHSMRLLPAHFTFGMVCRWWAELVPFKHDA